MENREIQINDTKPVLTDKELEFVNHWFNNKYTRTHQSDEILDSNTGLILDSSEQKDLLRAAKNKKKSYEKVKTNKELVNDLENGKVIDEAGNYEPALDVYDPKFAISDPADDSRYIVKPPSKTHTYVSNNEDVLRVSSFTLGGSIFIIVDSRQQAMLRSPAAKEKAFSYRFELDMPNAGIETKQEIIPVDNSTKPASLYKSMKDKPVFRNLYKLTHVA